ncbi:MAG: DUF4382 domain-containing protein [Halalkalicoccus sp.]
MKRRRYIETTGATVVGGLLAGCSATGSDEPSEETDEANGSDGEPGDAATGTLSTSVTDQPVDIDDFESCVVTIEGIWVKPSIAGDEGVESDEIEENEPEEPEGDAQTNASSEEDEEDEPEEGDDSNDGDEGEDGEDEEGEGDEDAPDEGEGRYYVEFDEPQEADLVQLQGANTQLIDETELTAGEYRFLQLDVSGVEGTLEGGDEAAVETPGNAPLQFQQSFEIRAGEVTRFVADFAPVRLGRGDRYLLRPVATGTQVLYGDEEYDPEARDDGEPDGSDDAPETDGGIEGEGTDGDERAPDEAGSGD